MSWRSLQLKQKACAQDELLLSLFQHKPVRYIGRDHDFAAKLQIDLTAKNLVAIINFPIWVSGLIDHVSNLLIPGELDEFYIGVNRYHILGNDTDIYFDPNQDSGAHVIDLLRKTARRNGYHVLQSDYFDADLGRHMNWAQPVTWVYGTSTTDLSSDKSQS